MTPEREPAGPLAFAGIDIATGNIGEMVRFYSEVLDVRFDETVHGEWTLYRGMLGGLTFLLAPGEPSGTQQGQAGVHQFHLLVSDIRSVILKAGNFGSTVEPCELGTGEQSFCLRDPDGHPWILTSR